MSKVLWFLSLVLLFHGRVLYSDSSDEGNSLENFIPGEKEPLATVYHCVNVVSGSFFQVDNDLVVEGPEPLIFTRCYDSSHFLNSTYGFGFASQYPLKIGKFWKGDKYYHAAIESQEGSYFAFKGEHSKIEKKVRVSLDAKILRLGLSNYSDTGISAHTNLSNIRGTFTYVDTHKKNGTWKFHYPDGSCRHYLATMTAYHEKGALLSRMQHPTGNQTRFTHRHSLIGSFLPSSFERMFQTNAAGKELNAIERKKIPGGYQLLGSNGQSVTYKLGKHHHVYRMQKVGKIEMDSSVLQEVSASHLPTTKYACYQSGKKEGYYTIGRVEKPDGRVLAVLYDDKGKVKQLQAPLGTTPKLMTLYTFDYVSKKDNPLTTVTNALGMKTLYRMTKNKRISSIEILENGHTHSSKEYFWNEDKGWLRGKAYRTSTGFVNKAVKYRYDQQGNILKETRFGNFTGKGVDGFSFHGGKASDNPESCSTYFTYSTDGFNLKLSEWDDFGFKTLYSYKPSTNLLTKKLVLHHGIIIGRTFHTYDDNAVLIKTVEDNGSSKDLNDLTGVTERLITTITPVSDPLPSIGKPAEITESYYDPETGQERLLRCTKYTYSPHGFVTGKDVFDANKNYVYTVKIAYDERDLIVKKVDPLGQVTLFDYDANHNKIYEEEVGSGKRTQYRYDYMNRLIEENEQHEEGSVRVTKHRYDLVGNRTATIDPFGNQTTYVYDFCNRLIETRYPPMKNAEGGVVTPKQSKQYDQNHRVVCKTDERGFSTETKYNAYDQPIEITYPDQSKETFVYFLNGRLQSKWDPMGVRTDYAYDPEGRVIREALYDTEGNCIEQTTNTYRGKRLIQETDCAGNITEYKYDGAGRKIARIRHAPEGTRETLYAYDSLNRLNRTMHTLETGTRKIEITEYDLLDRVIEERVEDSSENLYRKVVYAYDRNDNRISQETYLSDDKTIIERTEYDSRNNPIQEMDPLGHQTKRSYDYRYKNSLGQSVLKKTATDPLGGRQVEIFDAFDRLVSLQKTAVDETILSHHEIHYDECGNKRQHVEHVYENGAHTRDYMITWTFDPMGRVQTFEEPGEKGKITRVTYDKTGRKQTIKKPDGVVLTHTYYPTGLLKTISSSDGSVAYSYLYDANHNPIEMIDDLTGKGTSRRYNRFHERIEETLANGLSTSYRYDPLGRVTKMTLPNGEAVDSIYDAAHLVEVRYKDYCETYQAFDFRGLPGERYVTDLPKPIRMEWDEPGRRVTTDSQYWYEHLDIFDPKGNLLQLRYRDSAGSVSESFQYDPLDQLIEEQGPFRHTYRYDSLLNRLKKDEHFYEVNDLNQYESDGQAQYTFDPNGNLVEKIDDKGTQRFTYDAWNRLTRATIPDGIIAYKYDAEGRRLTKETIKKGKTSTTHFLYQFDTEIGACHEDGELDPFRILSNGKGTGSTIAVACNNTLYSAISDYRGNIRTLIDVGGRVSQTYRYSAFGERQCFGDQSIATPWGFANKRRDEDTGHIHFFKRDYLPNLGRWLTTDPLDFADGPNLYAYVRNNPLSYIDPDGQVAFLIPLFSWGATLVLPSVATVLTTAAYTAATAVAFYGGYEVAKKYNLSNDPIGSHCKNPRESTRNKHERANARRQKEQRKAKEKREGNNKRR